MADQATHDDAANGHTNATDADEKGRCLHKRQRNISGRSAASYGTTGHSSSSSLRQSMRKRGSSAILKRTGSTATTDQPFDRQKSLKSIKSSSSVLTRKASISRSEYHEDLKPILAAGLNINLVFTTFIIVFGSSFLFGYNIGVLNVPAELIKEFYNATYNERYGNVSDSTLTLTWSLTTAIFIPGGMIGAFLGGCLADSIGRKKTILLSHVFAFLGASASCACVAAKSPELMMLGRLLVGINSGLGNCIAPMLLSEIAPFNYRGAFGTLHQLSITLGILLSSIFGIPSILGTRSLWPYLILLEAGPALLSLIVLPLIPESPRYLLLVQQNRPAAKKALQFYRRCEDVDNDMEEMDTEERQQAVAKVDGGPSNSENGGTAPAAPTKKTFSLKQLLSSPDLRRPLIIACLLQVIQQFSGINAVFFYSQGIFKKATVPDAHIPYAIIGTNAVNVLMTIITVPLMDIAGRRPLLLFPMLAMIFDLTLMTVCFILSANYTESTVTAYVSVGCIIVYVIAFAIGLGPIPMMIGAELFRQGPRPKAMACAGVVNWICTFAIAMGFESIQNAAKEYTFLIFVILLIGFVIFTYFFVPETKNKTFEEIAHQFSPGGHLEVEEVVDDENPFDDLPPGGTAVANDEGDHEDHHLVTLNFGGGGKNDKHSDKDIEGDQTETAVRA